MTFEGYLSESRLDPSSSALFSSFDTSRCRAPTWLACLDPSSLQLFRPLPPLPVSIPTEDPQKSRSLFFSSALSTKRGIPESLALRCLDPSSSLQLFRPLTPAQCGARERRRLDPSSSLQLFRRDVRVLGSRPLFFSSALSTGTGGRTKWNRTRFHLRKAHCLDAACVGSVESLVNWNRSVLMIKCAGRGSYQRAMPNRYGFNALAVSKGKKSHVPHVGHPPGHRFRVKRPAGIASGDLVRAHSKHGTVVGRVAIRAKGSYDVYVSGRPKPFSASPKNCKLLQRADGYAYSHRPTPVEA